MGQGTDEHNPDHGKHDNRDGDHDGDIEDQDEDENEDEDEVDGRSDCWARRPRHLLTGHFRYWLPHTITPLLFPCLSPAIFFFFITRPFG